jgi:hypothetical protein
MILYSKDPHADRAFFKDVLNFRSVDAGHGWLIFALPPSEAAFHLVDGNQTCELYLMCDDLRVEVASLSAKGISCSAIEEPGWGSLTRIALPGGGTVGLYQPKHPTAVGQS